MANPDMTARQFVATVRANALGLRRRYRNLSSMAALEEAFERLAREVAPDGPIVHWGELPDADAEKLKQRQKLEASVIERMPSVTRLR